MSSMLCVHGLRVLHNKHFESTLLSSNIRPILFEFCELQYLHSIPYGTTLRQNLGLNSALPFKDSDTTWDSNYSHSGWETVSCSRWHQYARKKTRGASDCLHPDSLSEIFSLFAPQTKLSNSAINCWSYTYEFNKMKMISGKFLVTYAVHSIGDCIIYLI